MKEWTDGNKYNSFNSFKALVWREHFEQFAKGKDAEFLPPVSSDIDLSPHCNYSCPHCNAYKIIDPKKKNLPIEHWYAVSDMLHDWGVKSSCIAGGGEPMMHPSFKEFLIRQAQNGIENGVISNGSLMTDESIDVMSKTCRYVGISMDAGTNETYMKIKGIKNDKLFQKVITDMTKLANSIEKSGSPCDLSYKYLITPDNAHEIYEAAKLAKEIGVRDFHSRPVGFDNIDPLGGLTNEAFAMVTDTINEQIEKAMELEDGHFRFFGIRHKFKPNFEKKVNFTKCRAIPLTPTFAADGNVYLCFDRRGDKTQILCTHYPDPMVLKNEIWSSEFHKQMMWDVDPNRCPRCTYGPYNEMTEQVFMKDNMFKNFP